MVESGRKAAGLDPALATDAELCEGVVALERLRGLVDAAEAHLVGELDARRVTDQRFGMRTGPWLAREANLPTGVARSRVRVANALRLRLPEVDEALVEGRIGWDHAEVLTRACNPRVKDEIAAIQATLLGLADGANFDWWRRQVTGIVNHLDQDGGHDPNGDLHTNRLQLTRTFDGLHHLSGTFTSEQGAIADQAIEAKADELFHRFARDAELTRDLAVPDRATLRALAFVELCRAGQATDLGSTSPPRPEVTLAVNASDPHTATTGDRVALADGTTRTLLCDPDLVPLVVDSLGVPIDMGRRTRYATAHQRRAIAHRDGGCVFPGCSMPPNWTDNHHVHHHQHGGHTDLDNLASAVPLPPRRHPPHRLDHDRHPRRLVPVANTER